MAYIGDFRLGDTFDTKFTTVQATGAPFTLAGSPVISAYVGNSTTELTAGITLSVDFDGRTGLNNVRVVATGGNGYATASNYQLVITTGTVNSVSVVGYVIGEFSIEARSALMPTTAARTLVVDAAGLADANMVKAGPSGSGTVVAASAIPNAVAGAAGGLFIAGTNAATTITTALTTTFTGNLTGSVASVTGNLGGNVVGSVGSVTGAVGSLTTNNDKTGYTLTAGEHTAIATDTQTGMTAQGYTGTLATSLGGLTIKKNVALNNFEFLLVLSSDHATGAPGLAVTATRSIDGGAFAACANAATSISGGVYKINLAASDLNGNTVTFAFAAATADTTFVTVITQP